MRIPTGLPTVLLASMLIPAAAAAQPPQAGGPRWFRGNTHAHTLNSDGDSTPDDVVRWYREQRYHFVVLTDHNLVTPVDGLNALHAADGRFLVIRGEEVTDGAGDRPVHANVLGGDGTIVRPQGGSGPGEVLRHDLEAMAKAGGVLQINHPNFEWGLTAQDLVTARGAALLEVFNGHPQVNNVGGGGVPGTEALWDGMLSAGLTVFGVASDDTHELKRPWARQAASPGRGWVMVRAAELSAPAILDALRRGDFYATTGVELSDVAVDERGLTVAVKVQGSTKYTVQFVGRGGRILEVETSNPAHYVFTGDEGYVRAKVIDSNGLVAWVQPAVVKKR